MHSRGQKCFPQVSGWESRDCTDRARTLVEIDGEHHCRKAERQEQGLGLERQERRMQTQCTAQSTVPLGLGMEQRLKEGSDFTDELSAFPPQTLQEIL